MKKTLFMVLFLLVSLSLFAIEFSGILFTDYYGDIEASTPYRTIRSRLYYQPSFKGEILGGAGDFVLSANLFYQPLFDSEHTDNPDNPYFINWQNIPREAYISLYLENFDISIGQKLVSLGKVDMFSPLNCINSSYAFNLSLDDPYDSDRANPLLQVQYYPDLDSEINLVYVPLARPDYEPRGKVPLTTPGGTVNFDFSNQGYFIPPPDLPGSFHFAYDRTMDSYDIELSWSWYTDQTPDFNLDNLVPTGSGANMNISGTINSEYNRKHTIGGAYSTSIGGVALVEELAVNLTEDFPGTKIGVKNSDITLNSQITGTLPGNTFAQVNIIYQYIINFGKGKTLFTSDIDNTLKENINNYFNQPQEHIAVLFAHFQNSFFHDRLGLSLNTALLWPNIYIAPRVSFIFSDKVALDTGADINTGAPSSLPLARGNQMDNFYVRLKYEY